MVMLMVAPIAAADSPGRADLCHLSSEWSLISVSVKSLDQHLEHGDGLPLGEVPESNGELTFDESCAVVAEDPGDPGDPGGPGDPGDPPSAETVFAIAYSDIDGTGAFDPAIDVLIAKFVDGPSPFDNGVPGAGDLIVTDRYPLALGVGSFGDFGVTSHTVSGASSTATRCMASSATGSFIWDSSSSLQNYEERSSSGAISFFRDSLTSGGSDAVVAVLGSPSAPGTPVNVGVFDGTDNSFLEVETNCASS